MWLLGTSAVNNDMKVISTEVVELVGRAHEDLLRTLQEAQLHAEVTSDAYILYHSSRWYFALVFNCSCKARA